MIDKNNSLETKESAFNLTTIQLITSLFITLIGLAITLFGIKYTFDVFLLIYESLQNPENLSEILNKWIVALNINELFIGHKSISKLVVVIILSIGLMLLLRITLGFISAGTTILTNSLNSGETVSKKSSVNLDYKLNKLKAMSEQGKISNEAYQEARDRYSVQKIMGD